MQLFCMLLLLAVSYFLKADYGYKGFVFLLIMYWLHQHKPAQAVIGSCWLIYEWKACFAFIPLNMYNEKRGFIQGKWVKYLFYAFIRYICYTDRNPARCGLEFRTAMI